MNKKGQTLVIFIALIPVIIAMMALIVDVGVMNNTYLKDKGIIDQGIKAYFDHNNIEDTQKIYHLNQLDDVTIVVNDNEIEVSYNGTIKAVFGSIIHIEEYPIKIDRIGKLKENKIIIEKKGD